MADVGEDVELGEILLILAAVGIGIYFVYQLVQSFLKSATCLTKVGTIPGVTGATQAQVQAAATAAKNLDPGGSVVWSCGSDFDYAQPCGDVVQVRHSFFGQLFGNPNTYTTVPRDCYVRPSGGVANPRFACCYAVPASAAGSPACCGGKQAPFFCASGCNAGTFGL
jgi:hypothetical protein